MTSTTIDYARQLGGGCVLHSPHGHMYRVDNWSLGTGQVWGRLIAGAGDDYAAGEMVELAGNLAPQVYVIGQHGSRYAWVLNLDPCSIPEARAKIAWQLQGGAEHGEFRMSTWDAALCRFIVEGKPVDVSEGPYTERAWGEFIHAMPGVGEPV